MWHVCQSDNYSLETIDNDRKGTYITADHSADYNIEQNPEQNPHA